MKTAAHLAVHAVILAGGRGTRFWPRSRTRTPKQLLNIIGETTMLEQTIARLVPLIPTQRLWSVTNFEQATALKKQLPAASRNRVLIEPFGRNTAAAIALAAIHIRHAAKGDALMAVLPADQHIAQPKRYREILKAALRIAEEPGRMVVLGIPPTRAETGFGYIERMGEPIGPASMPAYAVKRFTEKPELRVAEEYLASGKFQWNAGMFFWRVSSFLDALKEFLPRTFEAMERLSATIGTRSYTRTLKRTYKSLESISVDYAILERVTQLPGAPRAFVIPAEVGWSDIGSWCSVYELLAREVGENVFAGPGHALEAEGNLLWSPKKFVAAIGVRNLVIVDTPDALLICPRDRAQDVGKIVKALEERKHKKLL